MGRNEHGIGRGVEGDPEQFLRVQSQDGSAVGGNISDPRQDQVEPCRTREIRHEHKTMDLTGFVLLLVDTAYFRGKKKEDICAARFGHGLVPILHLQREQSIACGLKLLIQLPEPRGMSKITGSYDRDAFELSPSPDAARYHLAARSTGIARMDVEICNEAHTSPPLNLLSVHVHLISFFPISQARPTSDPRLIYFFPGMARTRGFIFCRSGTPSVR